MTIPVRSWNGWFWGLVGSVVVVEIALLWLGVTLVSRTFPCFWAGTSVFGWDSERLACTGAGVAGVLMYVVPVVVSVVVLASLVAGIAAVTRTVVRTRRRVGPVLSGAHPARDELVDLVGELDAQPPPRVLEVDLREPVCFVHGLLAPTIVISSGLVDELDTGQIRAVLAHELRHVRVRDPLKVVAARGLSAAAFAFPVLRDLVAHILLQCELNADEAAAASAGKRTIADTLTQVLFHPRYAVDTAFGAPETARARVARLAGHGPPALDVSSRRVATSLASLVAIVGATAAVFIALPTPVPAYATEDVAPPSDLGWTSTPGPAPVDPQALGDRLHGACDPSYEMLAELPRPEGFGPPFPDTPLPLAVADSRGRVTVALFAEGRHLFVCHVDRTDPGAWQVTGASGEVIDDAPGNPVTAVMEYVSTPRDGVVTSVVGTVSGEVDEVAVELADGAPVRASVADGYYVAWWATSTEPELIVGSHGGQVVAEVPPPDISGGV